MQATERPIYLDHHATTPVDPRVADAIRYTLLTAFGNANSVDHFFGEEAAALVRAAQSEVAALVGSDPDGIHFTSGSTESIQLAIEHAIATRRDMANPLHVAATRVEHHAVLRALETTEGAGYVTVRWLPVDDRARLDLAELDAACREGTDLVCVMAANNEVGTVNPVEHVAGVVARAGAKTLIDATQVAGRLPLRTEEWGITYLTVSAHKIYGPKGVGALVTSPGLEFRRSYGAVRGVGPGTPNVPGITGLGEACKLRRLEMAADEPRIAAMRDRLQELLLADIPGLIVNGDLANRLGNNLHVAVPGIPNDAVVARLRNHVAISTGAACASGAQTPSHVLRAMRLPEVVQEGALRIGLGKFNTDGEVARAATHIAAAVRATSQAMALR